MKSIERFFLLGLFPLLIASCTGGNNKWYLGEWTDGENTFTLTKTKYSNPELGEECPITIRESSAGVFIDDFPSEEYGHTLSIDSDRQVILFENANSGPYEGMVMAEYHKKETEKIEKTEKSEKAKKTSQDKAGKIIRVKRAVFGTYENDKGDRVIIGQDGKVVYLYVDNWASSSGKYLGPGKRFICCNHATRLEGDLLSAGLLIDDTDVKSFVMNNGTMDAAKDAWKTSGGINVEKNNKGMRLKIDYKLLKPTPHGTSYNDARLYKVSKKTDIPSFTDSENTIKETSSSKQQKKAVFRRVDDVFNYLSKHTFKSENGFTIKIRPSGVSLSYQGRTHQISNAVQVSLNNEYSATIRTNSPYDGSHTFLVNCSTGQIVDMGSGGDYYYEQ